jgi:hypothetical protein
MSKLMLALVVIGFAFGVYWIGKSLHHAGNEAGDALASPIGRAALATAESNLLSADRAVASYYADNLTYGGLSTAMLQSQLPGSQVTVARSSSSSYCLETVISGVTAHLSGPNGLPASGGC